MPAIYDSLMQSRGLPSHKAWRVAYIVPFIIITAVAMCMLFLCEDTPTGKWSERNLWAKETSGSATPLDGNIVDVSTGTFPSGMTTPYNAATIDIEKKGAQTPQFMDKDSSAMGQMDSIFRQDAVVAPSRKEALNVALSLSTMAVAIPYACSFGSELAINSILGSYYEKNFPHMGQTQTGQWAAMFGLLNVVCRPIGGLFGDMIYRATDNVWSKKLLLTFLGFGMGAFQVAIGLSNPTTESAMFGLIAGMAFFLEACNGANFAVVPHVHPFANGMSLSFSNSAHVRILTFLFIGIVSGIVGGFGNLGGIIFAIIFRYNGTHYGRSLWIIGVISLGANLAVSWIRPVPKSQMS
jgi:NNP family nitrate/nitrite transporter-like MFS transporter